MLEVAEPTFQASVQILADSFDVPAAAAAGLAPDRTGSVVNLLLIRGARRFPYSRTRKRNSH
jgi:hypothetical protein